MVFEKNILKEYVLYVISFIVGMFSVSIANFFGGYYCFAAVIEVIALTICIYSFFEKKDTNKYKLARLILSAGITLFIVVFFVVNDIFKVSVYTKNNFDFWSVTVIVSQLTSIGALIYSSVILFLESSKKNKIEIIDDNGKIEVKIENNITGDTEDVNVEKNKEIKYIDQKHFDVEAPFMEEEN